MEPKPPTSRIATVGSTPVEVNLERVRLPEGEDLEAKRLLELWAEQERYVDQLEAKIKRTQEPDPRKREHLLVVRLAAKEQELQELSSQIAELKAAQAPTTLAMRNALLDPAVNLVVQKLKKTLELTKNKLQETQEELSAWKFTPDSVTGKRLMAKCRQLLQENEDLGKMVSSGRLAKLEGELSMQRALCEEMKKTQLEMDDLVQELDEDMEGMQSTIYFLQQQLKEATEKIAELKKKPLPLEEDTKTENPREETDDVKTLLKEEDDAGTGVEPDVDEGKAEKSNADDDSGKNNRTGGRRTKRTPVKQARESPRKGRSTRGQKRAAPPSPVAGKAIAVEDEEDLSVAQGEDTENEGIRPKRRRTGRQRLLNDPEEESKKECEVKVDEAG